MTMEHTCSAHGKEGCFAGDIEIHSCNDSSGDSYDETRREKIHSVTVIYHPFLTTVVNRLKTFVIDYLRLLKAGLSSAEFFEETGRE